MTWTWFRRLASIFVMHAPGLALALYTGTWWLALIPIQLFGQIPSSLTDDYGALLTTTLRAMQPRLHDNITRGNKFIAWLEMRGRWRKQDGGERAPRPPAAGGAGGCERLTLGLDRQHQRQHLQLLAEPGGLVHRDDVRRIQAGAEQPLQRLLEGRRRAAGSPHGG